MPGRGVEERVKSNEAAKGTRGSQRTSKGRAQGRGHGGHTASTTLHRDTGEGSTGGPREEQHHAPRHARHRHHTHRTHPTNPGNPPSSGRADGRGTAPDPKRPSQWWKAPPPGTPFRHPHSEQRRPARAHAVGPVLGPHARTDRARDTRVAEPWLHAPEDGRPGEGQRLTPSAPHNGGRHPPPGTPFRHPHSEQRRPAGAHAVGPVLGPHTRIDRTRDTRVAEPRLPAPEDRRPGEGQRLTPGAPHNGGRHPPPGNALPPPPQRATPARKGARCGAGAGSPRPHRPRPGHAGRGTLAARSGGRAAGGGTAPDTKRPSQRWKAPPPGDALPPPPQRATPARKGARCGAGAGSTRPRRPHPGHTGRGTPAARSGGQAAGGGTAPDTRRPSQRRKAPPPGNALPPPPQRATPARKGARCGAGAGSTRPHRPHPGHAGRETLAARSGGRAAGEGTAPDTRRPSQRRKAPLPGDALPPPPQRATPARKGARCGAGAGSTRPHRPHPGHTGRGTLAARSGGRAAGGGTAPDTRRPSQRLKAPPPGTPFRNPHSEQRRPARAHAVGPVLGPHTRIDRTRDTRVAEPWLPAPEDERSGEGQRLTPDTPHNGRRHPPRGRPSATPTASNAGPQGRTLWGRVLGPHARIDRTRDTRVAEPWLPAPEDGRPGEGQRLTPGAPHNGGRHPPRGRPSATPTASNAGPQGRTLGGRCWVHTPASTAPGTHGSRNPGCPLRRTGGRGRDSA